MGTELTITGGNFVPGQEVHIRWANPIGNPFTPRGMGETDITIELRGENVRLVNTFLHQINEKARQRAAAHAAATQTAGTTHKE